MVGVDAVPVAVNMVVDVAVAVTMAARRPWRYALSPNFRAQVDAELAPRSHLFRVWYLLWGSLAAAAGVALIGAVAVMFASAAREGRPSPARQALHLAESTLAAQLAHRAGSNAAK